MLFFSKNKTKKEIKLKGEFLIKGQRISSWKSIRDIREPRKSQTDRRLSELKAALDEKVRPRFVDARIFLRDHWNIMFHSAAENHLRIQQLKLKPVAGEVCNLSFGSYTELKRYQKKVRLFTYSFSSSIASVLVAMLIVQVFLPAFQAKGYTYYFNQTRWDANATPGNFAYHTNSSDRDNYSKYEFKDQNLQVINPGVENASLKLGTSNVTLYKTQTTDADFKVGNFTEAGYTGAGSNGAVFPCTAANNHNGNNWEPTDNDQWDLNSATGTIEIAGTHCNINNFTIASGKTVYVKAYDGTNYGSVRIYAQSSTITGTFDATGKGYAGGAASNGTGAGPGGGNTQSGGGNAGPGGDNLEWNVSVGGYNLANSGGSAYGDIYSINMGSGGGGSSSDNRSGGNGGGVISITTNGNLTVTGSVLANGVNPGGYRAGGGAGGTVNLSASGAFAGNGTIQASGGSNGYGYGGGGGGGRMLIQYQSKTFNGTTQAFAGPSYSVAGAGTIFEKSTAQTFGILKLDNNNYTGAEYGGYVWPTKPTPFTTSSSNLVLDDLIVTKKAVIANISSVQVSNLTVDNNASLNVSGNVNFASQINGQTGPNFTLTSSKLLIGGELVFPSTPNNLVLNSTLLQVKKINLTGKLTIGSGSVVTHAQADSNGLLPDGQVAKIEISAVDVDVQSGGSINTDSKGYPGVNAYGEGYGPGKGKIVSGRGGSGGSSGKGGDGYTTIMGEYAPMIGTGGDAYGSIKQPNGLGSSGSNSSGNAGYTSGAGGGVIKLNLSGTLTINGLISSNGVAAQYAGAGGGGSIWAIANTVNGSGSISAAGGAGETNGTGGGGRIAIEYSSKSYTGSLKANGGPKISYNYPYAGHKGAAGSIYLKASSQTNGEVIFDNSDNTISSSKTSIFLDAANNFDSVTLKNSAMLELPNGKTLTTGDLNIQKDASFISASNNFTVNGIFTLGDGTNATTLSINKASRNLIFGSSASVVIKNLATLSHDANTNTKVNYIDWTLSNFTVETGGLVDLNYKGFSGSAANSNVAGNGPGGGDCRTDMSSGGYGASYGGVGGGNYRAAYGSDTNPVDLGSGGGCSSALQGGNGGGAIHINASGSVTVNGSILANGESHPGSPGSGGGSGGSIWLQAAGVLSGTGTIQAKGGDSGINGGSGAGGRISLTYGSKTLADLTSASVSAGASSYYPGGNGTVRQNGAVIVFNSEDNQQFVVAMDMPEQVSKESMLSLAKIINAVFGISSAQAAVSYFESDKIDLEYGSKYTGTTLNTISIGADSGITLQLTYSDDGITWNNPYIGPGNNAGTSYSPGNDIVVNSSNLSNHRYLKYKATFNYGTNEPHLNDVTFKYTGTLFGPKGPAVNYHFDNPLGNIANGNTVSDSSINHANATASNQNGTGMAYSNGKSGQAISFDGNDDSLNLGNANVLNFDTGSFTLETWIKTSTTGYQDIIDKRQSSGSKGYMVGVNDFGKINAYISDGTGTSSQSNAVVNDGNWHHVVASFDKTSNLVIYVDGVASGTPVNISSKGSISNTGNAVIGYHDAAISSSYQYFNGQIDEFAIYDRALSASEVTTRYNSLVSDPSLLVKMSLDGSLGIINNSSSVVDASSNNNNGTTSEGSTPRTMSYVDAKIGQGITFDGADDNVTNTNTFVGAALSSFTLSGWFKTTDNTGTIISIASDNTGNNGGSSIGVSNGLLSAKLTKSGTVISQLDSSANFADNNWHYVSFTYDNGSKDAYLYGDGVQVAQYNASGTAMDQAINNFRIGNGFGAAFGAFAGIIDEVRVYNRAMNAQEISNYYKTISKQPASLISSWYNTTDDGNVLSGILWKEASLPAGTTVKMQVQTAPNNDNGTPGDASDDRPGTPTGFMGPEDPSPAPMDPTATFYSDTFGCNKDSIDPTIISCPIPNGVAVGDGVNDRWMQYKIVLDSDGAQSPQVDYVKTMYVVNANPVVSNVIKQQTEMQDGDGVIKFTYDLADLDSPDGFNFDVSFGIDTGITLANSITSTADTITLTGNYDNLPTGQQLLQIDQEQLICTSRTGNTLSGCSAGRGAGIEGLTGKITRKIAHNSGAVVWFIGSDANTTGGGTTIQAGTGYAATWNIKQDLNPNGVYNANAKLKVIANDGAPANQISLEAGATSAVFRVDTKDPELLAQGTVNGQNQKVLTIDRIANTIKINPVAGKTTAENTKFDLYLKDVDWGADCGTYTASDKIKSQLDSASTFPMTINAVDYQIPDLNHDPRKVCLKLIDEKSNFIERSVLTATPPANVKFYDFSQIDSDPSKSIFTDLIVWDGYDNKNLDFVKYEVYRANKSKAWVDANPASVPNPSEFVKLTHPDATITNINNNYFFDKFTDISDKSNMLQTYFFYKIVVTDVYGNVSALSSPRVTDIPDGQGGTDTKAPDLTIAPVTNKSATWAEIDFTADEIASGVVYYSTDNSFDKNIADPSYVKNHKVFLTGLDKNTAYNFKVSVTDPSNNVTEKISSLVTDNGPQISNVTFNKNSNIEASIFWTTDVDSTSKVIFSPTKNTEGDALISPITEEDLTLTKTHKVTIKNLTPGVRYFFAVFSTDDQGREVNDNNGGLFHSILTTIDEDAPIIANAGVPLISHNTAAIEWTTVPQPTIGKVMYRKSSSSTWVSTDESFTYDANHYVIINGLDPDTEYTYKIWAKNINGKFTTGNENVFKTAKDPALDHAPLSSITFTDPNPSVLTDTDAVISFATDQPANCYLEYGATSGSYDGVPQKEEKDLFNKSHNIHLLGLIFQTKYYYKVSCADNLGTVVSSDEKDFTTKEKQYTASGIGDLLDKIPPIITNVNVSNVTGESATITWDTDEKGSSLIKYGTTVDYNDMAGDGNVNTDTEKYTTSHSVTIPNLVPAAKYTFTAISSDAAGNISQSTENTFTTAAPSSLSSIKVESKNLGEATVSWKSSTDSTSIVEYGLTTSYGEKKENSALTKEHSISLSNLNQGTTYHYRVKGRDNNNNLYASADNTFEPKSPAQITDINVDQITEHGAVVSFKTNVPTDADVTYTDIANSETTGSQGNKDLATEHKIELNNLEQGTTFSISISVKDEQGTEATTNGPDFTTGKDEKPPVIEGVKTDSALTQSDKVQTIISWRTDEQATSAVVYKEGRTGEEKEVKISDNLASSHIAVITIFKPGIVYNFKVKSIDASGNEAISNDFALLTPRRKENIIQIIINNFQEIFGWARF